MKNILILFFLLPLVAFAQSPRVFTAKCNIAQTGSGSGYWTVAVTQLNDPGGMYDATEIQVNDKVLFNDGGMQYALNITVVVSASGSTATLRVSNVGVTGISSVPTTSAIVTRGTENYGFFPFAANVTDNNNQLAQEYNMYLIDSLIGKVDSAALGITWTEKIAADTLPWRSVVYGNNQFVAVAAMETDHAKGTGVMTSPDGIKWTLRNVTSDSVWWNRIIYANGIYVASGLVGNWKVAVSTDAINWSLINVNGLSLSNEWRGLTYGNGTYVATATDGSFRVMTSPDGFTWTARNASVNNAWYNVKYANGLFVAIAGTGGTDRVMTSPDGITWTTRTTPNSNNYRGLCYGNGLWVATSTSGTGNRVMTSSDGITWTARTTPVDNAWQSVTWAEDKFVAVAVSGGTDRVMTSPDGINWTIGTTPNNNQWMEVCYGNGMLVAVSDNGINRVMTSGSVNFTSLPSIQDSINVVNPLTNSGIVSLRKASRLLYTYTKGNVEQPNGQIVFGNSGGTGITSSSSFSWLSGTFNANSGASASMSAIFTSGLNTGATNVFVDNNTGAGLRLRSYGSTATGTLLGGVMNRAGNCVIAKSGGSNKLVIDGVTTDAISIGGANGFVLDIDNSSTKGIILYGPMYMGGKTSSFASIVGSSSTARIRLGDNSDFAAAESLYERFGYGSPEGAVTAPVGAVYHRTDGGTGTSFYVKESGAGNTGWLAK